MFNGIWNIYKNNVLSTCIPTFNPSSGPKDDTNKLNNIQLLLISREQFMKQHTEIKADWPSSSCPGKGPPVLRSSKLLKTKILSWQAGTGLPQPQVVTDGTQSPFPPLSDRCAAVPCPFPTLPYCTYSQTSHSYNIILNTPHAVRLATYMYLNLFSTNITLCVPSTNSDTIKALTWATFAVFDYGLYYNYNF